jgi:hypothetical protein
MIIINAPAFFTFTWRIIRGFIDARNAAKVELYGKSDWEKDKWRARLLELVDVEHIPIPYRDPHPILSDSYPRTTVENTLDSSWNMEQYSKVKRRASYYLHMRTNPSTPNILLSSGEVMIVSLFTRSTSGAFVQIYHSSESSSSSSQLLYQTLVEHKGDGSMEESPTCIDLTSDPLNGKTLDTPGSYTITIIPSGRVHDGIMPDDFVVATWIYPIQNLVHDDKSNPPASKDILLISPNVTRRVRGKDRTVLFRTPDDLSDCLEESLEVPYSPGRYEKHESRWKSSRYFCGIESLSIRNH